MNNEGNWKYTVFWPTVFVAPFIICFLLFSLFPIIYSFGLSFTDWSGIGEKKFIGLGNYVRIFTKDITFLESLGNTLYIMLLGFPLSIFLGLMLAAFLSNLKKFRNLFQTINFLPYITTPVAIGLVFTFLFDWNTGIINRVIVTLGGTNINWLGNAKFAPLVIGFMIIWKCTGYYMALYLAGITGISEDIYEAAKIDGASAVKTFFKITVPLLKPITVFIILTSVIYALQLFDEPNLMFNVSTTSIIGGPDRSCLTMVWNFYDTAFGSTARLGYGSAIASTLFGIIVVISLVGMKLMNGKEEK